MPLIVQVDEISGNGQRYAKSGAGVCKTGVKSFRHHGAHVADSLQLFLVT